MARATGSRKRRAGRERDIHELRGDGQALDRPAVPARGFARDHSEPRALGRLDLGQLAPWRSRYFGRVIFSRAGRFSQS